MPYFSRLTDIVTCNLSSILAKADDPASALAEMISEMNEGAAGADRSVQAAIANVVRIESEIGELRQAADQWVKRATEALRSNDESAARTALERKQEVEDLIAGLEQQLQAAVSTRDHLQTMRNALQARLSDARRRLEDLRGEEFPEATPPKPSSPPPTSSNTSQSSRIDAELAALKQQLQAGDS
ncbi:MAG: PspA/IM30 family protein [Planctomycetaceae bacterium]|nr:PspA/IM30 family protein [Planctomycetaceae bacterium]